MYSSSDASNASSVAESLAGADTLVSERTISAFAGTQMSLHTA